jgi:hypothetical protein
MDQAILVVNRIGAGEELLKELRESGFPVDVAFWTEDPEFSTWRLVIASPEVDRKGLLKAYLEVLDQVKGLPSWHDVDTFEIKLVGVRDRVAKAVASYADRYLGQGLHRTPAIYHDDVILGQTYIYPKT